MNSEAKTLRDLVYVDVDGVATIPFDPIADLFEQPTKFTQLADKLVRRWRDRDLRSKHVSIFK